MTITKKVYIECDRCGYDDEFPTEQAALDEGWARGVEIPHLCMDCADEVADAQDAAWPS